MQIVIEISDDIFDDIKHGYVCAEYADELISCVEHGTPLPKGHGDLIDRSKIYKAIYAEEDNCTGMGMTLEEMDAYNNGIDAMYSVIDRASTIIPADKGDEE